MYAPRTGGPGYWPPSSDHWKSGQVGTLARVEYEITAEHEARHDYRLGTLHLRELVFNKRGKLVGNRADNFAYIYKPGIECRCQEVHDTAEDAMDCATFRLMKHILAEQEEREKFEKLTSHIHEDRIVVYS